MNIKNKYENINKFKYNLKIFNKLNKKINKIYFKSAGWAI